jgi:Zn-dependent oligopeptidase
LDESTRNKVKELKEKISKLEVEFSKNTNEESTKLTFTKDQLSNLQNEPFFDALITKYIFFKFL